MQLPDFLTAWPNDEIVLTGHRIGLVHLVHYYKEGYSPEMLAEQFPTLPLALIHKVIGFYLENQIEVDALMEKHRADMDRQRAAGRHPDRNQLRKRFEQLHQARCQAQ